MSVWVWLVLHGEVTTRTGGHGHLGAVPQTADERPQRRPSRAADGAGWLAVQCVRHGVAGCEGPAVRPGLLECGIAHART
jgi:hypothetical protein